MRVSADIRMDRDWIYELFLFTIEVVKVVTPQVFDISWVDPTMAVWCLHGVSAFGSLLLCGRPRTFLMNNMGGRSSRYQLAGISTRAVCLPPFNGCIQ